MRKYIQRVDGMILKDGPKISVLLIGLLTGCAGGHALWDASDAVVYREDVVYSDSAPMERGSDAQDVVLIDDNNDFVNYRQTASDYRGAGRHR